MPVPTTARDTFLDLLTVVSDGPSLAHRAEASRLLSLDLQSRLADRGITMPERHFAEDVAENQLSVFPTAPTRGAATRSGGGERYARYHRAYGYDSRRGFPGIYVPGDPFVDGERFDETEPDVVADAISVLGAGPFAAARAPHETALDARDAAQVPAARFRIFEKSVAPGFPFAVFGAGLWDVVERFHSNALQVLASDTYAVRIYGIARTAETANPSTISISVTVDGGSYADYTVQRDSADPDEWVPFDITDEYAALTGILKVVNQDATYTHGFAGAIILTPS